MSANPCNSAAAARRARRGSALVESALILLVFVALLVGIFDISQALFLHETLVEQARNACRYGVVHYDSTEAIRNMVLYNRPTAPTDSTSGIFGLTASMVDVTRASVNSNEERMVVTITGYPFVFLSPWMAGRYQGRPIVASLPVEVP